MGEESLSHWTPREVPAMGLLLTGVRDGLSKEVTFKLDLNDKKELTMMSWRQNISGRGRQTPNTEVGKKCVHPKNGRMASVTGTFMTKPFPSSLARKGHKRTYFLTAS